MKRRELEHLIRAAAAVTDQHEIVVVGSQSVPTMGIGGEGDKFTPVWLSQRMAEFIPGSEYVYVPGGTHTAPLERPGLVNAAIDRFLRERVSVLAA